MNKLHAYILSNSRNIQCRYADSEIVASYVITDGLMHSLTYLENDQSYNFDFFFKHRLSNSSPEFQCAQAQ